MGLQEESLDQETSVGVRLMGSEFDREFQSHIFKALKELGLAHDTCQRQSKVSRKKASEMLRGAPQRSENLIRIEAKRVEGMTKVLRQVIASVEQIKRGTSNLNFEDQDDLLSKRAVRGNSIIPDSSYQESQYELDYGQE